MYVHKAVQTAQYTHTMSSFKTRASAVKITKVKISEMQIEVEMNVTVRY